jgi:hypothetical protein
MYQVFRWKMQIIMRKQLYLREKGSRRSNEEILFTSLCDASEKIKKNNSRIKIQMFLAGPSMGRIEVIDRTGPPNFRGPQIPAA